MKFHITVITEKDVAKVKNTGKSDLIRPNYSVCSGQTVEMTIAQAKARFGDWEDDSFKEKKRKEEKGLHHFKLEITHETPKVVVSDRKILDNSKIELVEFADLNDEEPELVQCEGKTKAGSQCKRMIPKGEKFCPSHKE